MKASARSILEDWERSKSKRQIARERERAELAAEGLPDPDEPRPYVPPEEREPLQCTWTPEHVGSRLLAAVNLLWVEEGDGPDDLKAQSIGYTHSRRDVQGWDQEGADSWRARGMQALARQRAMPSPYELTLMSEALQWPLRYLREEGGAARMLQLWLRCRGRRKGFARRLALSKLSERTGHRKKDRALDIIAAGLRGDGVAVR